MKPHMVGNHIVMGGARITANNKKNKATRYGSMATATRSNVASATAAAVKYATPMGGVTVPNRKPMTQIIAACSGG